MAGTLCLFGQAAITALAARGRPEEASDVAVALRVTLAAAAGVTAVALLAFVERVSLTARGYRAEMATDVAPASSFGAATQRWFEQAFGTPTPAQAGAWPAIARGEHVLVCAPTGSGKTLAAFLAGLDRLLGEERVPGSGPALLYLSPLKALNYDVERNLRSPLAGIRAMAAAAGEELRDVEVAVRTGDTPADARRRMARRPPDVLITTPESLFLMLTSSQRSILRDVRTVIIDEVHAMAATKRGAHLALSLERLSAICHDEPQRVALSATQRPLEEVARFVGGDRPVTIVDAGVRKELDLEVRVPGRGPGRPRLPRRARARACRARSPTCRARPTAAPARSGPRSTPSCSSSCARTARR